LEDEAEDVKADETPVEYFRRKAGEFWSVVADAIEFVSCVLNF
jgi:hypothetical protein